MTEIDSDKNKTDGAPPAFPDPPRRQQSPYSEQLADFKEAVECLYVRANLSGRLKFREQWPQAAARIFSPELIVFDREGTTDLERRAALEDEAEQAWAELAADIGKVEAMSVVDGMLQPEFVKKFIEKYGCDFCAYIYAPHILDRFAPPGSEKEQAAPPPPPPVTENPPPEPPPPFAEEPPESAPPPESSEVPPEEHTQVEPEPVLSPQTGPDVLPPEETPPVTEESVAEEEEKAGLPQPRLVKLTIVPERPKPVSYDELLARSGGDAGPEDHESVESEPPQPPEETGREPPAVPEEPAPAAEPPPAVTPVFNLAAAA